MSEGEEYNSVRVEINDEVETNFPSQVVIIPIMNTPIFPGMIAPIILSEDKFTPDLDKYLRDNNYVALNLVKISEEEKNSDMSEEEYFDEKEITSHDIYKVGILCKVVKKLQLPDGSVNLLAHGIKRYRADKILHEAPLLISEVEVYTDILEEDDELDAYTRSVINQVKKLSENNPYFNEEMKLAMLNSPSPGALADLVAFAISLEIPEAQDFLETLVVKKRFAKLLVYLKREKDVADIQKKISDEVNDKANKYQREYFLREQLKVIRSELGMDEDDKSRDLKKMNDLILEGDFPEDTLNAIKTEMDRLELIPDSSPEYNLARTYINWILDLPWNKSSEEHIEIEKCREILDKDHYGLEKAKERILEFLAVRILKPKYDGTILCLAGPPGVGKTSLGKSIARSLGRKFYRFSLGGMRDEAEIKGHRRTYVGAMPGRIVQALKRVSVNNPVIMLDEIDKLTNSHMGDPSAALLEVLDPEQNSMFIDNYLDVPFDLSKVLFIATANYINDIPTPLLDRMEVIELSGYSIEEKISIGKKWVIPKQLRKHGLKKKDFTLSTMSIKKMIADYAREPGVRMLEQTVAKLCRKAALKKISEKAYSKFSPAPEELEKLLGGPRFLSDVAEKILDPGIVTGLAWTAYGGEILLIETIPLEGKGGFKLTGQLGDVMNESASLAYSYIKRILQLAKKHKENDFLENHDIHLHLPAGATPKDGPSAGVAMALALYSLSMGKRIKSNLAMTGELSLTGRVLPVGGIKEKVLGAKRAGIKSILLPKKNERDLLEVPQEHRKGINFVLVEHFDDVLKAAIK